MSADPTPPPPRHALDAALHGWRTPLSAGLTLLLVVVVVVLRTTHASHSEDGIPEPVYLIGKLTRPPTSGILAAGASGIDLGLVPEEMEPILGREVVNFGFKGVGFDDRYCRAIGEHVATVAPGELPPVVLLGVNPLSLSARAARESAFLEWLPRAEASPFLQVVRGHSPTTAPVARFLDDLFGRMTLRQVPIVLGLRPPRARSWGGHRATGWTATDAEPRNPRHHVAVYEEWFRGNPVDPALIDTLLEHVAAWSARGIVVVGIRTPASPEVRATQHRVAGMPWDEFIVRFRAAGGRWIGGATDDDDARYATYDGGHLAEPAAREFSRDLARRLVADGLGAATESPRPDPAPDPAPVSAP